MGWDAIIAGELRFPKGKIEEWKNTPARVVDRDWPRLIEHAIKESAYDNDPAVVDILVGATGLGKAGFGHYPIQGDVARVRFYADSSNWSMVAEDAVRIVCAATRVNASGRVLFADAGDTWASLFNGALVELNDGVLTVTSMTDAALSRDDKALARAVIEEVTERHRDVAEQLKARFGKRRAASPPKKAAKARKSRRR
jgi:hypothetical protein